MASQWIIVLLRTPRPPAKLREMRDQLQELNGQFEEVKRTSEAHPPTERDALLSGAGAAAARETAHTRDLQSQHLLQAQRSQLSRQDEALDRISAGLDTTKQVAIGISDETDLHMVCVQHTRQPVSTLPTPHLAMYASPNSIYWMISTMRYVLWQLMLTATCLPALALPPIAAQPSAR